MNLTWKIVVLSVLGILLCIGETRAQSETNSELEDLRRLAQAEIAREETVGSDGKEETFTSGALGLQALNPEISITGDILWSYADVEDIEAETDFLFRGLGIHAEAYLDPFTRFKAAFSANEDETTLGEAYMTRFGLVPRVNLTLGKFRQQFGVVNRWHKHGLDQVDFPLALRQIFGPAGLNQTGCSLDWTMPDILGNSQELTFQITDGENGRVFAENEDKDPSVLAHYKVFRDLSASTYVELGFSGLYGRNNEWNVGEDETLEKNLNASVLGVDFTMLWEPSDRMRYRNLTWRTEAYVLNKDILAPDGSGEDSLKAWGMYSYIDMKVSRTLVIGVRGDYFEPDSKAYAMSASDALSPLLAENRGASRWQVGPYITWHQSPFVHFRAECDYQDGDETGLAEAVAWLQCIFAAGPHKHERY